MTSATNPNDNDLVVLRRETQSDTVVTGIVAAVALLLPFEAVGIHVASYLVSLSTVIGIFLSIYLALLKKQRKGPLLLLFAVCAWFLLTAVIRAPSSSYVMSLAAFALMAFPVISAALRHVHPLKVFRAFRWGFYATAVLVLAETALQVIFPAAREALQAGLLAHTRTDEFLGLTRMKGLMLEPAHLAIYLAFSYAIFDSFGGTYRKHSREKLLAIGLILLTLSLSGVLILLAYAVMKRLRTIGEGIFLGRRYPVRRLYRTAAILIAISALFALYNDVASNVFGLFATRTAGIATAIASADYVGSVGSRSNALPVMVNYWLTHWPVGTVAGTGYANVETWLIDTFGHLGKWSSFARGELNSIIAAVGLSTGIVGLSLYFGFLVSVLSRPDRKARIEIWSLLIAVQLAYGFLIGYLFWHFVLILVVLLENGSQAIDRRWKAAG